MPKKRRVLKKPADIKRQLRITERELRHLNEAQWSYAKRMLKFGFAAWVFGFLTFFFAILMMNVELFGGTQPVWAPSLVIALAAPVMITAMLVRKFAIKIKRLERIRRGLLVEYEKAVLQHVEKMVTSRG
jgi:hypothetical protein